MTQNRDELIEAIFTNMQKMHRSGANKMQALMKETSLSPSQMELILTVKHHQPVSAKEIALAMNITPGAVAHLLEQLEAGGLLDRSPDAKDKRIINISLSGKGKKKLQELWEKREAKMRKMVESFEAEELAVMLKLQEKMITHLENEIANQTKETK